MKTKTIFPCWDNEVKSYKKGGQIECDVCHSFSGVRARNYYRNDVLKLFKRCVNCQSLEVTNNRTGEILKQEVFK